MGMEGNDTREQFEEFYAMHVGQVLAYVRRRTESDAVDDVVSETFLIAWRRLADALQGGRPWLFRTAANVLRNRARGESRQGRTAAKQAALPAEASPDHADPVTNRSWVLAALRRLSSADRETLMLAYWEGLDNGEIAESLDCSRPTVALRLHRARRRLQRILDRPDPTLEQDADSRSVTR